MNHLHRGLWHVPYVWGWGLGPFWSSPSSRNRTHIFLWGGWSRPPCPTRCQSVRPSNGTESCTFKNTRPHLIFTLNQCAIRIAHLRACFNWNNIQYSWKILKLKWLGSEWVVLGHRPLTKQDTGTSEWKHQRTCLGLLLHRTSHCSHPTKWA